MPLYYSMRLFVAVTHILIIAGLWIFVDGLLRPIAWSWFYVQNICKYVGPSILRWWRRPTMQLANHPGPVDSGANRRRRRKRHFQSASSATTEIFHYLDRAQLDACQLVCTEWNAAIESSKPQLTLRRIAVTLRPSDLVVEYTAHVDGVGSAVGHVFGGLRRCDQPLFRNAVLFILTARSCWAWTGADMTAAFFSGVSFSEMNASVMRLKCDAYAGEVGGIYEYVQKYAIRILELSYKRSLLSPGSDFLASLFSEARKCDLDDLTVALDGVCPKSCDVELQVGYQLLSEIFMSQRCPAAKQLTLIIPPLKSFQFLRRIVQAYRLKEIARPLTIGCFEAMPLAEMWPDHFGYFVEEPKAQWLVPLEDKQLIMTMSDRDHVTFYSFMISD